MYDLLSLIYQWFFDWFIVPIWHFVDGVSSSISISTPIVITMPGSNTPLITTDIGDIFVFGGAVFLFIGSIICFIGVLKFMFKMGKRLFGGRR